MAAGFIPAATLSLASAKRRYEQLFRKIPTVYRKESSACGEAARAMRGNHLGSLSYKLRVAVEDFAQVRRWFDSVLLHHLKQTQDVAHTRQRHAFLARQVLDDLHLADVPLRVAAPVGGRAVRLDELSVLVQHQGARVRLQDLRRHA